MNKQPQPDCQPNAADSVSSFQQISHQDWLAIEAIFQECDLENIEAELIQSALAFAPTDLPELGWVNLTA